MIVRRTFLMAAMLAPAACSTLGATPAPASFEDLVDDPHTYARPNEARVNHVSLDLRADFTRKVLSGTASLDIMARPGVREIVLDAHGLNIQSVRDESGERAWRLGESDDIHGAPLTIQIRPATRRLTIAYETAPDAGALQWLAPAQTSGAHPFLFSQGQSILTRSWIPTQDSPGIRQTYDARIVAPEGLRVLMSAEHLTAEGEVVEGGRAFRFRMQHAIPPYLIAIAVGDIAFRSLGPRSGVFAEPAMVEAAANEFVDVERMISATETLYGPYRWGRYDIIVLPPSFPYGGMENPMLTFATPTIIAGDRSLVSTIAHELAHSWSGNLVTNATWADFWLNESFTTYIEERIVEALYGQERADMARALTWAEIQTSIADFPDKSALHRELSDPDDTESAIVYDKGAAFLHLIESEVGRAPFDAYLRSYFDRHAFQPMTTAEFLADLRANLIRGDAALEQRLQLDAWAYQPGLPSNAVAPHAVAFDRVDAIVVRYTANGRADAVPWSTWSTLERQRFLRQLPRTLTRARLDRLERAFSLNETGNNEVLFDWLMISVRNRYGAAVPTLERFLLGRGRVKFLRPLYEALMGQGEWGRTIARRVYARARPTYHPVAVGVLDPIVSAS